MQKTWKLRPSCPEGLAAILGLPPIVAQVLYNRDIATPELARSFTASGPGRLHDPLQLPGMERAVQRLIQAIQHRETIGVFGDFDVDGVTATTLLTQALEPLGVRVAPYIPHRVSEGHGLNSEAVTAMKDSGVSLLVTVDCGISSYDEVVQAVDSGMDVVITDHHAPPPKLPPALAVVDPKVPGSAYPFDELTGAGLALKLIQGLYQSLGKPLPPGMMALAALGTVADLAPLLDENRCIVKAGLEELCRTGNPGLQALYKRAGLRPETLNAEAIAFGIAPRLNASGRVKHAEASFKLLNSRSESEAEALAQEIEQYNYHRRTATDDAHALALSKAPSDLPPIILMLDDSFSPGINGLVASRLAEEFYRPAVVMSPDPESGLIRASGRSIPDFDLIATLYQCRDLFQRVGGHPMAAGFVMEKDNLPALEQRLTTCALEQMKDMHLTPTLWVDAEASPHMLMGECYRLLAGLEPFGAGNREPLFLARGLRIDRRRTMGSRDQHLRFKLHDGRATWDAVAFRQGNGRLPETQRIDAVYCLKTDVWDGRRLLAMRLVDFRPSQA
jgi:single-stranded-DNA-specific exonuclease